MQLYYCFILTLTLISLSNVLGKAKVTTQVTQDLNTKSLAPILVQLHPADVPTLNINQNSRLAVNEVILDAHADNVVDVLNTHAEQTKGSVQDILEKYKKEGKIKDYRFYSISNTFAVEAPKELIDILSNSSQVEEISSNRKVNANVLSLGKQEAVLAGDINWTGKEVHWSLKFINATKLPREVTNNAKYLRYANADTG
ncbi:hypothetical protein K502DRAFT_353512, partial [Neoconidiobolus thromboides FSU 785]